MMPITDQVPLRILLVDDIPNIKYDIQTSLKNNGFVPSIEYVEPTQRELLLSGCQMPSNAALEEFDFALIDLELFFPSNQNGPDLIDMQGGTQILPYLRKHAPWLPAIAESRLFLRDVRHESLHLTGCFGFDGTIARDFFTSDRTNRQSWDDLRKGAELRRLRSLVGDAYVFEAQPIVHFANSDEDEPLAESLRRAQCAVGTVFHGSKSVTLDSLAPGFSGAEIYRALVVDSEQPNRASYWIAKVSSSPSKLHEEATAHTRMMKAGHEFAVSVPLLWRDVVVRDHVGVLAYRFAEGTEPASRRAGVNLEQTLREVATVVRRFHGEESGWSVDQATPREVVRRFAPSAGRMATAVALLPPACKQLYARLVDSNSGVLGTTIRYRSALIHGDLHFDNILLGDRSVLIDFAKSAPGPLAVDLARLHADFYRVSVMASNSIVGTWSDDSHPFWRAMPSYRDSAGFGTEDQVLFDILTWTYVVGFLAYEDTPDSLRDWLLNAIPKFTRRLKKMIDQS
jgi:hypothetical protein